MEKNKTRKPYEKPSMEVIKVDPMMILAGSPGDPEISGASINGWVEEENSTTIPWDN